MLCGTMSQFSPQKNPPWIKKQTAGSTALKYENVSTPPPLMGDRPLQYSLNLQEQKLSSESCKFEGKPAFSTGTCYNAVPPPAALSVDQMKFPVAANENERTKDLRSKERRSSRSTDKDAEKKEHRTREDRDKRSRSPSVHSRRSRSPHRSKSPQRHSPSPTPATRQRSRVSPRYVMQIPKISFYVKEAGVSEVKRRYPNLYIPSDFSVAFFRWMEVFPMHRPLDIHHETWFHIMSKDVESAVPNPCVLEPPDANYEYSAKVMLLSTPALQEMSARCCPTAEQSKDEDMRESFVHPTRLINFLVGLRGKNETMAIGGPWSPSVDGEDPENDPTVLIKTAIRTCRSLTGIDLSQCTVWYRFLEINYDRAESIHKEQTIPARVETVVIYIPDIWNCVPTRSEWGELEKLYKSQQLLKRHNAPEKIDKVESTSESLPIPSSEVKTECEVKMEIECDESHLNDEKQCKLSAAAAALQPLGNESPMIDKASSDDGDEVIPFEDTNILPEYPEVIVHPSRTAKSGKFDCTVMSLSLLLDYRAEDTKEHSFEVSLFAELFNEMVMRDFAFRIYVALVEAPERDKDEQTNNGDSKRDDGKVADPQEAHKSGESSDDESSMCSRDEEEMRRCEPSQESLSLGESAVTSDNKVTDSEDCIVHEVNEPQQSVAERVGEDDTAENMMQGINKLLYRDSNRSKIDYVTNADFIDLNEFVEKKEEEVSADAADIECKVEPDACVATMDNGLAVKEEAAVKMDVEDTVIKVNEEGTKDDAEEESRSEDVQLKPFTVRPSLLISFVYFDQSHCGYIFEKDVEEIINTLTLNLTRAQIRRLLHKVCIKDVLEYRKLTDVWKSHESEAPAADIVRSETELQSLAAGNLSFMAPVQLTPVSKNMMLIDSASVWIPDLVEQVEKSQRDRNKIEDFYFEFEFISETYNEMAKVNSETAERLESSLQDCQQMLQKTEEELNIAEKQCSTYQEALQEMGAIVQKFETGPEEMKDEDEVASDEDSGSASDSDADDGFGEGEELMMQEVLTAKDDYLEEPIPEEPN